MRLGLDINRKDARASLPKAEARELARAGTMKLVAAFVGGFLLAAMATVLATVVLAGSMNPGQGGAIALGAFLLIWPVGIIIGLTAPSAGNACRQLSFIGATLSFALPIGGVLYSSSVVIRSPADGAETVVAAIGGGLFVGVLGLIGLVLGLAFMAIGLFVSRDK